MEVTLDELLQFIDEMWQWKRIWSIQIIRFLKERGASIYHSKPRMDVLSSPSDIGVFGCFNVTREQLEEFRQSWISCAEFTEDDKRELDETRVRLLEEEVMSEDQELTTEWSRLNKLAKDNGMPNKYIPDLFGRVCASQGLSEPKLTKDTVKELAIQVEKELNIANAGRAADQVEHKEASTEWRFESIENPTEESEGGINSSSESTPEPSADEPEISKDSAKKKRGSKKVDAETVSIKSSTLEEKRITNASSGEVVTFNEVMKRWFMLQIKKATIKVELDFYKNQCQARLNDIESAEQGWIFCYRGEVAHLVKEQFKHQRKPTGEYKPATVKTEYATFKRNPEEKIELVDKDAFLTWANAIGDEEIAFFGDIVTIDTVKNINFKAAISMLASGDIEEIPGFTIRKEPDEVGIPTITLSTPRKTGNLEESSDGNLTNNETEKTEENAA